MEFSRRVPRYIYLMYNDPTIRDGSFFPLVSISPKTGHQPNICFWSNRDCVFLSSKHFMSLIFLGFENGIGIWSRGSSTEPRRWFIWCKLDRGDLDISRPEMVLITVTKENTLPMKSSGLKVSLSQIWTTKRGGRRSSVVSKLQKWSYYENKRR